MEPKFSSDAVSGWAIAWALECARARAAQLSGDRPHSVRVSTGAWATVDADNLRVYAKGITSWDSWSMEHYIETTAVQTFGPLCMVYSKFPMREDRYTVLLACHRLDSVSFQRAVTVTHHDQLLAYRWADPAPTREALDVARDIVLRFLDAGVMGADIDHQHDRGTYVWLHRSCLFFVIASDGSAELIDETESPFRHHAVTVDTAVAVTNEILQSWETP